MTNQCIPVTLLPERHAHDVCPVVHDAGCRGHQSVGLRGQICRCGHHGRVHAACLCLLHCLSLTTVC